MTQLKLWCYETKYWKSGFRRKDIKKRWQQYTENLYRRDPKINDIFNDNLYEDETDILEIEVIEEIRHIYNRKSPGYDGIPI